MEIVKETMAICSFFVFMFMLLVLGQAAIPATESPWNEGVVHGQ